MKPSVYVLTGLSSKKTSNMRIDQGNMVIFFGDVFFRIELIIIQTHFRRTGIFVGNLLHMATISKKTISSTAVGKKSLGIWDEAELPN